MNKTLKYNGELVNVDGHNIHIYRTGNIGTLRLCLCQVREPLHLYMISKYCMKSYQKTSE